jgi:hypothetical protein
MRKVILTVVVVAAAVTAAPAAADGPPPNDHNCAGMLVSGTASEFGPVFGEIVSTAAHFQAVDNFGLANCGQPPRNNP